MKKCPKCGYVEQSRMMTKNERLMAGIVTLVCNLVIIGSLCALFIQKPNGYIMIVIAMFAALGFFTWLSYCNFANRDPSHPTKIGVPY